jgi:hypothetical protein
MRLKWQDKTSQERKSQTWMYSLMISTRYLKETNINAPQTITYNTKGTGISKLIL